MLCLLALHCNLEWGERCLCTDCYLRDDQLPIIHGLRAEPFYSA